MQASRGSTDRGLIERLDDMQARLEVLEDMLLPPEWDPSAGSAAVEEPATEPVEEAAVYASAGTDLRSLQAASEARPIAPIASPPLPASDFDLVELSERFAGRALALAGGAALILGAVFFLSLAFSRGWIGPQLQVALGLTGGSVGLALGAVLLFRGDRVVGHVLAAVGLAVLSLSLFAATSLYELIDPALGLVAALGIAVVTTAIAVVTRSQVVAGFGLVAVLAAPPIMGAPADAFTVGFLIVVLVGVAAVALWQTWSWLPVVAFVLSAPQVWAWIASGPAVEMAAAALVGYWALLTVAAGGEAFRHPRQELTLTSAPLFLLLGAFTLVMASRIMPDEDALAAFLLLLAALHGLVAAWFVARRGELDPFGLLAGAYGIAMATMAVPLLVGGPTTVIVWAAEAAVLAVLAGRRSHGPSAIGSVALFALAAVRLSMLALDGLDRSTWWDYALSTASEPVAVGALSLLVAGTVAVALVRSRGFRLIVVGIAAFAMVPVAYLLTAGTATVAAWCGVFVVGVSAPRWLSLLPERDVGWRLGPALEWLRPQERTDALTRAVTYASATLAYALAVLVTAIETTSMDAIPAIAFSTSAGHMALLLAAASLVGGLAHGGASARHAGIVGAAVVIGLAAPFQLTQTGTIVLWAALAVVLFALDRLDPASSTAERIAAACALAAAGVGVLVTVPPDRLTVSAGGLAPHPPFISEATLVLAALVAALVVASRLYRSERWSDWALVAGGAAALYGVSVGIVDVFAGEAYGLGRGSGARLDELAKEAQVSLSVVWTIVGVLITGAGLLLKRSALRIAGLAVLALAAAKVFIVDLSSLDVAYRVVTLLVLGVLFVAVAWVWTRLRPPPMAGADDQTQAATGVTRS